jgi:hypothetical protein
MAATVAAVLLLGACSSGAASPPANRTPAVSHTPEPLPSRSLDPNFDWGQVVLITPAGPHPAWLVATCCRPITWVNQTTGTVSVAFDHQAVRSGAIPPGGRWTYHPPNVESIVYRSGQGVAFTGNVQVNQTFES